MHTHSHVHKDHACRLSRSENCLRPVSYAGHSQNVFCVQQLVPVTASCVKPTNQHKGKQRVGIFAKAGELLGCKAETSLITLWQREYRGAEYLVCCAGTTYLLRRDIKRDCAQVHLGVGIHAGNNEEKACQHT